LYCICNLHSLIIPTENAAVMCFGLDVQVYLTLDVKESNDLVTYF